MFKNLVTNEMFVAILGDKFLMASRKSSLASENYHFTSSKPTGNKSSPQAGSRWSTSVRGVVTSAKLPQERRKVSLL